MSWRHRRFRHRSWSSSSATTPSYVAPPFDGQFPVRHHFESWAQFYDAAWRPVDLEGQPLDAARTSLNTSYDSWAGGSVEEARKFAEYGWLDGAEQARKYRDALFTRIGNLIVRHDVHFDVTGSYLDVGRFVSGEPECWGVFEERLVEGPSPKFFKLMFNLVASADVGTEILLARAAVAAALAEAIEFAGHRCEVIAAFWNGVRPGHDVQVVLKRFGDSLDLPALAYAVGHPTVLRRHYFALAEREPRAVRGRFHFYRGGGYGSVGDVPEDERTDVDVYLPGATGYDARWKTQETAIAWILDELRRLGIALTREAEAPR